MIRFIHRATILWLALLAALVLTLWIYWPGQTGPLLLDDHSSVLVIQDLQQNGELARDYLFGDGSGPLGRPVAMASFVLEKLYLGDSSSISKRVNILLHLANGALVAWLLLVMFRSIGLPAARPLAVLLATVWLLSPLYVSTVLYIVQRMAMLATTFMLLALICYCQWREQLLGGVNRLSLLLLVPLFGGLALFAKENAIVLLPVLLLLEALWFQFRGDKSVAIGWLRSVTLGAIALGGLGLLLFLVLDYGDLAGSYRNRYFSLEERLLTEGRILWDYAGQLLWPEVNRMGLYHDDVTVSRFLLEPGTTAFALSGWALVLVASLVAMRWRTGRYLALGPLWFLAGHSVESTVWPLELYFEHRNYFPGIGLLLVPALLLGRLIGLWPQVRSPLLVYVACYGLWLATLTSSQVSIWSSRPLLAFNHINAHPESFRANTDMAVMMAELGDLESARRYSRQAFEVSREGVERHGDFEVRDLALSCITGEPVAEERINAVGRENAARPLGSVTTLLTLVRLLQDNVCPGFDRIRFADRMAEIYLVDEFRSRASANIYSSLAVLENALARYDNALRYTEQFLALAPDSTRGLLMKLHFTTALGQLEQARAVISRLQGMDQDGRLTVGEQQTLALYLENS